MNYRHTGWIDFCVQQDGWKRGGSRTVLFRLTPLGTNIAQSRRDEAEAGVVRSAARSVLSLRSERGVAGSGTYFNTLLGQRLALLQILLSPVCL